MKNKTIDYVLRTTWLAVQKMYNEEASKFDATMATAFTLLSIDPKKGTSSTSLGPIMGMESTSLSRILKSETRSKARAYLWSKMASILQIKMHSYLRKCIKFV